MKQRKYWYMVIMAGVVLSLAGCGGKKEEAVEATEAAAEAEAGAVAGTDQKAAKEDAADEAKTDFSIADVVGEKGAKLYEETSDEELLAMIPETEITVAGYYKYYAVEKDNSTDIEITGHMKEFEVLDKDNECITVKGIVENDALKTENPVQGVYFLSINDDETALILISATVTDDPETVHIIPTVPFPTTQQLLDMGLSIKIYNNTGYSDPIYLKDYVTEIWYDEEEIQTELTDWDYTGRVRYLLNGVEQCNRVSIQYLPYEDEDAAPEWTFYKKDNVFDEVAIEESGIPEEQLHFK